VSQVRKKGEVQLLAGGKDAAKPDLATLPSPLSIWWTAFVPATPAADGTFAAGDYVCRFSVNGVSVVEKPFQIVSGCGTVFTHIRWGGNSFNCGCARWLAPIAIEGENAR